MTALRWSHCHRETLNGVLPSALVILPIGATEQHGPHLATGTDALIATAVAERAADRLADTADVPVVLAPTLSFGASDHHLPFGGTLSLAPQTLLAVLGDLLSSLHRVGARGVVLVNGHGGNVGVAHAAAARAAATTDLRVAHIDYWTLAPAESRCLVPGHAGEFETSLVAALSAELVSPAATRERPAAGSIGAGVTVHAARDWADIDGYTDDPSLADADTGERRLHDLVTALHQRLAELVTIL